MSKAERIGGKGEGVVVECSIWCSFDNLGSNPESKGKRPKFGING